MLALKQIAVALALGVVLLGSIDLSLECGQVVENVESERPVRSQWNTEMRGFDVGCGGPHSVEIVLKVGLIVVIRVGKSLEFGSKDSTVSGTSLLW